MNDVERFLRLAQLYKEFVKIAFDNLGVLKRYHGANAAVKFFTRPPLNKMRPFNLSQTTSYYAESKNGKSYAIILGELNEKLQLDPSITERIFKAHCVGNFINQALRTKETSSAKALVQPLQEALLDFYFLEKVFGYCAAKAKLVDGMVENYILRKVELETLFADMCQGFLNGLNEILMHNIDLDHLDVKLKQYEFRAYSWVMEEVGEDGKVVNDYLLPRHYWEPFLSYAQGFRSGGAQ
jgi:hypothetical protein